MYINVTFRPGGVPTRSDIIDAASAGFSSRNDQSCLDLFTCTTYDDAVSFLKRLISWNHTSVLEHIVFKFQVSLSTACAAQFTRHRIASYTQKSYRLRKDVDKIPYILPPQISDEDVDEWKKDMESHLSTYNKWLQKGYEPDVARFHLPQGTYTNLAVTMNARSMRNLFTLRLDKHAMFEFRDICAKLYSLIKERGLSFLFEDIVGDKLG